MSTLALLLAAYLAVFAEAALEQPRRWLGAQIDLLPALMVYASLTAGVGTIGALAVLGGLWFDSLSGNRLGISILPLWFVGLMIYQRRDLILRDEWIAQLLLGLGASALVPLLTLGCLWGIGEDPIIGWGSIWQWLVMSAGGALAAPCCFQLFARFEEAVRYPALTESAFRPDREIKRGRT